MGCVEGQEYSVKEDGKRRKTGRLSRSLRVADESEEGLASASGNDEKDGKGREARGNAEKSAFF